MAATHLTLEEAADRLNLTPEEFKRRLKTDKAFKDLDAAKIRDGTTFRFKPAAVEELARQLGVDSNPELPLSPLGEAPPPDSDDFKVPGLDGEPSGTKKGAEKKPDDEPLLFSASDDDIFSLAADDPPAEPKKGKAADSDARLEGDKPKKGKKAKDDEAIVPTEEIDIDFGGPGSAVIKGGSSAKLSAPKSSTKLGPSDSGKGLASPGVGDSSEFELSLDADSDDFELKLNADTSDEVDLGEMPRDPSGSSSGKRGGESGILNRTPADSGILLDKGKGKGDKGDRGGKSDRIKADKEKPRSDRLKEKPKPAPAPESDSEVDFELTLDSSAAASAGRLGGLKDKGATDDSSSDSEFELTLDDGASSLEHAALDEGVDGGDSAEVAVDEPEGDKGDIFETDFEIPSMDESGSEAVALETSDTDLEKSDFDIADDGGEAGDGSGSEVVLLEDEEEAPTPKARKGGKKPAPAAEDEGDVDLADVEPVEEDDGSAAGALKGVKGGADDEEEEEEAVGAGAGGDYRPAPWGIIPALLLLPTAALTLVGAIMAFQLLQTMSGYQQPRKPAAPLIRDLAKSLEMPLNDQ